MTKYKTISYATMSLYEMIRRLEEGKEPDMEQFFAAATLLFGQKHLMEWRDNGDFDRIKQALQQNLQIFKDAETTGDGFIKRLYNLHTSGKIVNRNGENLLDISEKLECGDIGLKKEIISDIARVMDVSETVVIIAMVSAHSNLTENNTNV